MNWGQFKDPVYDMCPAVVACWSLTQEMASWSPFMVVTNIFVLNSVKHLGKTPLSFTYTVLANTRTSNLKPCRMGPRIKNGPVCQDIKYFLRRYSHIVFYENIST